MRPAAVQHWRSGLFAWSLTGPGLLRTMNQQGIFPTSRVKLHKARPTGAGKHFTKRCRNMAVSTRANQDHEEPPKAKVVFLHGLARGKGSMQDLAEIAAGNIRQAVGHGAEVWGVSHSMGGIILRHIQGLPDAGGVKWLGSCMIAPPNRGSCLANTLCQYSITKFAFQHIFGEGAVQLGCLEEAEAWPMPPMPCGVIAGKKPLALSNPTSWMTSSLNLFTGDHDGTVRVEETRLSVEVMTDFVELPVAHTFMMYDKVVMECVTNFLSNQNFNSQKLMEQADFRSCKF